MRQKKTYDIETLRKARKKVWVISLLATVIYLVINFIGKSWSFEECAFDFTKVILEYSVCKTVLSAVIYYVIFALGCHFVISCKIDKLLKK